ncbi:hypothetical protein H4R34_002409 [Dimargaris verticillata]|uniref:aspartyl aminopeptidase n=1 Tax=Dimargaris verticillata TaxID=2761393 RepID=A0A9W8B3X3_9FUNG|nr:hypothetical protein H4R34_002409 [Dimargaris verticillata]
MGAANPSSSSSLAPSSPEFTTSSHHSPCGSPFTLIPSGPSHSSPTALCSNPTVLPPRATAPTMLPPKLKAAHVQQLRAYANKFLDFVNASPSPFHAVDNCRQQLLAHGYQELKERQTWQLAPNGKYFFTRNASSIVAFAIGGQFQPNGECGTSIVAAHTDSPCLKVKPISKQDRVGCLQVGVQCYGGGLWHTWFDRDLSVAGRVMVTDKDGQVTHRLVRIPRPIMRIPNLAIHLDRGMADGFKFNKETHLTPILATVAQRLNRNASAGANRSLNPCLPVDTSESESETLDRARASAGSGAVPIGSGKDIINDGDTATNHHPELLQLLADELGVEVSQIMDFELCLHDTQPATLGGVYDEFIFSPRLDNLMMSYTALQALLNATSPDSTGSTANFTTLADERQIRLVALFDNEEVGSMSAYGADSALLETTLKRLQSPHSYPSLAFASANPLAFEQSIHHSYLVSADMAHAVHPNYVEKHEARHRPLMHNGVVIKINANQRYATTAPTSAVLKSLAQAHGLRMQEFVVRNDSACGSTIGPMLSAKLGLRTIDVGCPQLAMHSIREMAGADDVGHAIQLFEVGD